MVDKKLLVFHFDRFKPYLTSDKYLITEARWQLMPLYEVIKKQLLRTEHKTLEELEELSSIILPETKK